MKLIWLLIGGHLVTAILAALAVCGMISLGQSAIFGVALAAGIACVAGVAMKQKLQRSIDALGDTVRLGAPTELQGIIEFDRLTDHIRDRISRWSDAATSAQQGLHDVEHLVAQMDGRPYERSSTHSAAAIAHLRRLISGMMKAVQPELNQLGHDTGELESKLALLTTDTSDQGEAVSRTTTYVEQLSLQFDSVAEATNAAQKEVLTTHESSLAAQKLLNEHVQQVSELKDRMEGTERRLRALRDRSQSIEAIIEIIGDISSRTDLLALNASIESFRAGEQGRGFSVVADEVRKLAEQSAQSTREISALIEAIQADADESVRTIAEQRREIVAELSRVERTGDQLSTIGASCDASVARLRDITQLAGQQLHLTQGLVAAVERISETNRQSRSCLDEANWMVRSITKTAGSLHETLQPLRLDEVGTSRPGYLEQHVTTGEPASAHRGRRQQTDRLSDGHASEVPQLASKGRE
jgi:methyl-accepting chemotaxis protein